MPSKIADSLNWAPQTVRETIHRWNTKGLGGLWEAPGRGGKPKWLFLPTCLPGEMPRAGAQRVRQSPTEGNPPSGLDSPRTYNSRAVSTGEASPVEPARQLAQKLESDRLRPLESRTAIKR